MSETEVKPTARKRKGVTKQVAPGAPEAAVETPKQPEQTPKDEPKTRPGLVIVHH